MSNDPLLELLKQTYQPVLSAMERMSVQLTHLHMQEGKLFIGGIAGSEQVKDEVWNAIKAIDPAYKDLIADIKVDPSRAPAPPPTTHSQQIYIVQAGDTLSLVSKRMYGDAEHYMKIFEANRDKLQDPDHIEVGQQLIIPVLES